MEAKQNSIKKSWIQEENQENTSTEKIEESKVKQFKIYRNAANKF